MKKVSSTIIFLFFFLFSKASMSYADKIENWECLKYFVESSFSEATTSCLKRVNELINENLHPIFWAPFMLVGDGL